MVHSGNDVVVRLQPDLPDDPVGAAERDRPVLPVLGPRSVARGIAALSYLDRRPLRALLHALLRKQRLRGTNVRRVRQVRLAATEIQYPKR